MNKLERITDVFDFSESSFIAYKNSGDEDGLSLPYKLRDETTLEMLVDVDNNTCLEFNTSLSNIFAESGTNLKLKISTDKIENTKQQSDEEMMMFRAQIVSYFLKEQNGELIKEEAREKEDEKCLCPDCDMNEDIFVLDITDRNQVNAFNIDIWGNINGTAINQNRKCLLTVSLVSATIDPNLRRDNSIIKKEYCKTLQKR